VLKDNGVMGIMLYAKYGREGVYQMQSLMRLLNKGEENMQEKVENCKAALKELPLSNAFKEVENIFTDVSQFGDAGVYDLFLHSNDIAYTVPDIYAFLASAKLHLTHFHFGDYKKGNDLYNLESYVQHERLQEAAKKLSLPEKQAAAELMHGKIIKHIFYAAKHPVSVPSLDNLDYVPIFSMLYESDAHEKIHEATKTGMMGDKLDIAGFAGRQVSFIKMAHTDAFFQHLDGTKSLREIFKAVRDGLPKEAPQPNNDVLKKEFQILFEAFNKQDFMYLKEKSVPTYKTINDIAKRLSNFL
jgi:hypothetical protein